MKMHYLQKLEDIKDEYDNKVKIENHHEMNKVRVYYNDTSLVPVKNINEPSIESMIIAQNDTNKRLLEILVSK